VLADAPGADEAETGDEGDGREGVEEGVECRKEEQMGSRNIGGRMIIDEPAEEEAGDRIMAIMAATMLSGVRFSLVVSVVMAVRQRS
jgi:hypothetical protein